MSPTLRLKQLGIVLPEPAKPVANYVPYKHAGLRENWFDSTAGAGSVPGGALNNLLFTSGMIPVVNGIPAHEGKLGAGVTLEQGRECAVLCTLNALSWVSHFLNGTIDRVYGVLQVRGFVACTPDFYEHPAVLNACSDLLVDIFGDSGRHTRAAVGCPSLPLNVPVEIDFVFQLR